MPDAPARSKSLLAALLAAGVACASSACDNCEDTDRASGAILFDAAVDGGRDSPLTLEECKRLCGSQATGCLFTKPGGESTVLCYVHGRVCSE